MCACLQHMRRASKQGGYPKMRLHMNGRRMVLTALATTVLVTLGLAGVAGAQRSAGAEMNKLTPAEVQEGFTLLFDGKSLTGWERRGNPKENWEVQNGEIVAVRGVGGGHALLATTGEYRDVQLRLDFWAEAGNTNAGLFLRAPSGDIGSGNAFEINIYDSVASWPTGSINNLWRNPNPVATAGKWNTYDITVVGNRWVMKLNGEQIVDVVIPSHKARPERGAIALQHGGKGFVKYRNIRVREIKGTT